MRIQIISPGSAAAARVAAAARAFAGPGTEIAAVTVEDAPVSIEGPVEAALALSGILDALVLGEQPMLGLNGLPPLILAPGFDDPFDPGQHLLNRRQPPGWSLFAARPLRS